MIGEISTLMMCWQYRSIRKEENFTTLSSFSLGTNEKRMIQVIRLSISSFLGFFFSFFIHVVLIEKNVTENINSNLIVRFVLIIQQSQADVSVVLISRINKLIYHHMKHSTCQNEEIQCCSKRIKTSNRSEIDSVMTKNQDERPSFTRFRITGIFRWICWNIMMDHHVQIV